MRISEEARWIQRRIYATSIPMLLAQGSKIEDAIAKALHYSAQAAICFEQRFPSAPVIDTTARQAEQPAQAPSNGSKMQPGIENYQPPPKVSTP